MNVEKIFIIYIYNISVHKNVTRVASRKENTERKMRRDLIFTVYSCMMFKFLPYSDI